MMNERQLLFTFHAHTLTKAVDCMPAEVGDTTVTVVGGGRVEGGLFKSLLRCSVLVFPSWDAQNLTATKKKQKLKSMLYLFAAYFVNFFIKSEGGALLTEGKCLSSPC